MLISASDANDLIPIWNIYYAFNNKQEAQMSSVVLFRASRGSCWISHHVTLWAVLWHHASEAANRANWRFRNYNPLKPAPTFTSLASLHNKKDATLRKFDMNMASRCIMWKSLNILRSSCSWVHCSLQMAFLCAFIMSISDWLTDWDARVRWPTRLWGDSIDTETA